MLKYRWKFTKSRSWFVTCASFIQSATAYGIMFPYK